MIFAYGLEDPVMSNGKATISYHGTSRRFTRIIPLRSYSNPPAESKFADLEYFDFRLNKVSSLTHESATRSYLSSLFQYAIPANDTVYHCKIFKAPTNFRERRHAIAVRFFLLAEPVVQNRPDFIVAPDGD